MLLIVQIFRGFPWIGARLAGAGRVMPPMPLIDGMGLLARSLHALDTERGSTHVHDCGKAQALPPA